MWQSLLHPQQHLFFKVIMHYSRTYQYLQWNHTSDEENEAYLKQTYEGFWILVFDKDLNYYETLKIIW